MNVTAGIHIDKSGKNYTTLHNERKNNKFNSKNKNIDWNLTKYNRIGKLHDANKLLEKYSAPYVKKYNQRQIKQGHRKRCYKSVKDYVHKRGKKAKRRGVIYLGNKSFRDKYETALAKKNAPRDKNWNIKGIKEYVRRKDEPKLLIHVIKKFNRQHRHIKICRYACHQDEGTIHAHVELVALPNYTRNKNPRPSFSFNKALEEDYPNAIHEYSRTAKNGKIRHYRQHDGRVASHLLDNEIAKNLLGYANQHDVNLHLVRTGKVVNKSGNNYKRYAKMRDKANSATNEASSAVSFLNNKNKAASSVWESAHHAGYRAGASYADSLASNSAQNASVAYSESASASASSAVSKAKSAINNEKAKLEKNKREYTQFLVQQLELAIPKDNSRMSYTMKKNKKDAVTGRTPVYIDGHNRYGLDLITHLIANNIYHHQNQANTERAKNDFKDYEKNTKKNPTRGGKDGDDLQL